MVGSNLAEVMEHDGPICARGPSGRRTISLVRISLCVISAAFRDKRRALCRHTYVTKRPRIQTASGGREPCPQSYPTLHMEKWRSREGQSHRLQYICVRVRL